MLCSDSDNLGPSDNPKAQQYTGPHTLSHALVSPSSGLPGYLGYDSDTRGSRFYRFTFNSPLITGDDSFTFTAPGSEGAVEISADLGILPWLSDNWDKSVDGSFESNPPVKVTFGRDFTLG